MAARDKKVDETSYEVREIISQFRLTLIVYLSGLRNTGKLGVFFFSVFKLRRVSCSLLCCPRRGDWPGRVEGEGVVDPGVF